MKSDLSLDQLGGLDATQGQLDQLLEGHAALAEAHLRGTSALRTDEQGRTGPRVVGVGVTQEVVDGRPTGRPALLVLVDRLEGAADLAQQMAGSGVPIVVEAAGEVVAMADLRGKYRPAAGGVSIAPQGCAYAGTLGCMVRSGGTNYILGASHTLGNFGDVAPGTALLQPSGQDGGSSPDAVGAVAAYVPIPVGGVCPADAGLARITDDRFVDPRLFREPGVLEAMVAPAMAPILGLPVQKSGRTTGHTQNGVVSAVGIALQVGIPGGLTTFQNMFAIRAGGSAFAAAGDSGAVVTTRNSNQPMGLMAFSDQQGTSYASPMPDVLTALAILTGDVVQVVYSLA